MFGAGRGGHVCPRCDKKVYFAEEIIAMGSHWHKNCFSCASCKKRLDSRSCTERNNEAYCTHCYAKLFGPKGYGFGQGAGVLSMDNGGSQEPVTSNISSYAQAQVAPLLLSADVNVSGAASLGSAGSRTSTPSSSSISPPLGGGGPAAGGGGHLLHHQNGSHSHQQQQRSSAISGASRQTSSPGGVRNGFGGSYHHHGTSTATGPASRMTFGGASEICRRCSKPVYLAERMIGAGSVWHKLTCFSCVDCNKKLESTSLCDKDGEIFCKTCYGRKFGPKGYGYGVGAGTLQMQQ